MVKNNSEIIADQILSLFEKEQPQPKNCPICQFEGGKHSLECPKYKNRKWKFQSKTGWEEGWTKDITNNLEIFQKDSDHTKPLQETKKDYLKRVKEVERDFWEDMKQPPQETLLMSERDKIGQKMFRICEARLKVQKEKKRERIRKELFDEIKEGKICWNCGGKKDGKLTDLLF